MAQNIRTTTTQHGAIIYAAFADKFKAELAVGVESDDAAKLKANWVASFVPLLDKQPEAGPLYEVPTCWILCVVARDEYGDALVAAESKAELNKLIDAEEEANSTLRIEWCERVDGSKGTYLLPVINALHC